MLIPLILLIVGLVGIWVSAGIAVEAARKIAKNIGLTETCIGLTVISIGTSFPEIFTHIISSMNILKNPSLSTKLSGIAIGTDIGSNIVQITFVLGVVALLTKVKSDEKIIKQDYWVMIGAIVLLFLFGLDGTFSRMEGFVLVAGYAAYLLHLTEQQKAFEKLRTRKRGNLWNVGALVFALAVLLYATSVVIDNAVILTDIWNVTGSLIGTLLIGVATALPEFTTAVRAILKGSPGISLGTLIGSNITNPMLGIGIGSLISTFSVSSVILWYDLPFWFFISIFIWFFFTRGHKLFKSEAIFIILSYIIYAFVRLRFFAGVV